MEYCNFLGRMHFWCLYLLMLLCVIAQDPNSDGFISIDCGLDSNTSYVDSFTGLTYVSDDQYIDTGVNGKVSSQYSGNDATNLDTLRSFPNSTRNCYTLTPVTKGLKYLVRATFYYGNYDGLGNFPSFDLYFGVNFWITVDISKPGYWLAHEIIAIAPVNYIQVCLVNKGLGTPFISTLELRPLSGTIYKRANSTQSLVLYARNNVGSNHSVLRYPTDAHDRLWLNYTQSSWVPQSTSSSIDGFSFEVPSPVLQTAAGPSIANESIDIYWPTSNKSTTFYVVLHFAEVQILQNTDLREFYVYSNGEQVFADPERPSYLTSYSSYNTWGYTTYNLSLISTPAATLPPMLNALELYTISPVISLPTYDGDFSAINSIKSSYSVSKGWNGDPCVPKSLGWTGVSCAVNSSNTPRITALNLSSSRLTWAMVSAFGYLTALETLDLSHNNLSGIIPSSLDQLMSLTFLDLSENNGLLGPLPPGLLKKQNSGLLTVNFNSSASVPETKKSRKAIILVIVIVAIVLLILGALALFFLYLKKKHKKTDIKPPAPDENTEKFAPEDNDFGKRKFSFAELNRITNNLRDQIGVGGFGEVFKGCLETGKEVAVKLRSESSSQGIKQFLNEVENLSRVHHKNLVELIGYCKDGNHIAVVYEYMQGGNLQDWLRGNARPLPWKPRLRIAYESAQGLDYLHKMCNPPLIHRDVKTNNILLSANLEAKISDFGLARSLTGSHVSTKLMGTAGYLDPEYASSLQLNEKSDVYSFGVVLLEIVTGKSPIHHGPQGVQHLSHFVKERLSKGNIESVLDANMGRQYNLNSIWKVAELALRCTDHSGKRPDMTRVVTELKESLDLEMHSTTETSSLASGDISQYSDHSKYDYPFGANFEMAHIRGVELPDSGPSAR